LDEDEEIEAPRSDSPRPEPLPSRSSSPTTQSCPDAVLNKSTPDACAGDWTKESGTAKHYVADVSIEVDQPPLTVEKEEESDGNSTIEGSITSYDEIIEVVPKSKSKSSPLHGNKAVDHGYNPTRLSNPEPYEGWDSLLTELRASGLILKDGNGDNFSRKDESSCSYGSESFESENDDT